MNEALAAPTPGLRRAVARWHLPTVFAAVFVAFCLPFATVSCNGAETTFTGMQLVSHTVPDGGTFADEDTGRRSEISDRVESRSSITATLVLIAAALGLGLALARRRGTGWCAGLGLVFALFLGANTGDSFLSGPDVTYHWGYWSTLLVFVWACLVQIGRAILRRRRERALR
jgi:hypothetical protein